MVLGRPAGRLRRSSEAQYRLQSGFGLYPVVLVRQADGLRGSSEAQPRLRKGLGVD